MGHGARRVGRCKGFLTQGRTIGKDAGGKNDRQERNEDNEIANRGPDFHQEKERN
jgi:hypothetical protein